MQISSIKHKKGPKYSTISIAPDDLAKTTDITNIQAQFGLYVLGTEKHDSRRIDNQLRGRSGRQGDAGVSQFFVSLDDEIMRKMGGEKIQGVVNMMMATGAISKNELESMELTQSQFTSAITRAQKQMEGYLFGVRKHLFEYDSVVNKQRMKIYKKRDQILDISDIPSSHHTILINTLKCLIRSDDNFTPDSFEINTQLADFLESIPNQVIAVTNASGEKLHTIRKILENYNIDIYSLSGEPNKTDLDYRMQLSKHYNLSNLDECIYIDHLAQNIDSAKSFGIKNAYIYTDDHQAILHIYNIISASAQIDSAQQGLLNEVRSWITSVVLDLAHQHIHAKSSRQELIETINQIFAVEIPTIDGKDLGTISDHITNHLLDIYDHKMSLITDIDRIRLLKSVYLDTMDKIWIEHIDEMTHLRDKVGLYGYAQQDPLVIYKKEGYEKFAKLENNIHQEVLAIIYRLQIGPSDDTNHTNHTNMQYNLNNISTNINQLDEDRGHDIHDGIQIIDTSSHTTVIYNSDKLRPNDKVNVVYTDGKQSRGVKYKTVKDDIQTCKCKLI